MSDSETSCDVLILGAGPAGCTAALYAARAGLRVVMLSPAELAGMMAEAPPVGNFPGQVTPVPGKEILLRLREQALAAGARHELQPAQGVYLGGQPFQVFGGTQDYTAGTIIVATGAWSRAQRFPGEEELVGKGVARCVACDGPLFRGEDVLVVGQDEEAAREALALAALAQSVRVVCPAKQMRVEEDLLAALAEQGVEVLTGLKLDRILGEEQVTGAVFRDAEDQERVLEAGGVFLYLRGAAPATDFLLGALTTDEKGYLITDELMQTSVAGVFAAGDVRSKQARQMVVACAEGAMAALAAERYLRGGKALRLDRGPARG